MHKGVLIKFLDKILEGGEEPLMHRHIEMIEIAINANKELKKLVNGDRNRIEMVKVFAKESDDMAFKISNSISSGVISPNVIDSMLRLTRLEDNIVDSIYILAREVHRYSIPNKGAASKLQTNVMMMLEMADSSLQMLKRMLSSDDTIKIRRFRKEVAILEQDADDIKDSLLDEEYKSRIDYKAFLHIGEVAHAADDILDSCDDSAAMFLSIMLSIMT